jgi:hypothetical protein
MNPRSPALALVLGMLVAGACAKPQTVELGGPARQYKTKDYPRVLDRWTRHGLVLKELDTALDVHATFLSRDFRAAYSARYSAAFRLPPGESERFLATQLTEAQAHNELYLSVSSSNPRWNELEKPKSIWRLSLVDDSGREVSPAQVKAHRRPDERSLVFFPYVTVFARTYSVRFPVLASDGNPIVGPGRRSFTLRFSGPLGALDLAWIVRR